MEILENLPDRVSPRSFTCKFDCVYFLINLSAGRTAASPVCLSTVTQESTRWEPWNTNLVFAATLWLCCLFQDIIP